LTLPEIALASFALLITPGPTNTLVFLAGAERGLPRALRLIPVELAGYLLTVIPLTLFGAAVLDTLPVLKAAVAIAAGIWVAILAVRLWHPPATGATGARADPRTLFVTTTLNPKALIFGLVLLPSSDQLALNLVAFAVLVMAVAILWAGAGAMLRRGGALQPVLIPALRRTASVWLGVVSIALLVRGMMA